MKKITDIVRELKEQHPDFSMTAKDTNQKLVEAGLLYRTENGSRATVSGKERGICEEERRDKDNRVFTQILYNESAEALVRNILYPQNINYRYSRTYFDSLKHAHPGSLIILEAKDKYWVYDNCAEQLCKILDLEPYENASRQLGVTFYKNDISTVTSALKAHNVSYYVDSPFVSLEFRPNNVAVNRPAAPAAPATATQNRSIQKRRLFSARTENNTRNYFIADADDYEESRTIDRNGLLGFNRRLRAGLPNGIALFVENGADVFLGKEKGDMLEYDGEIYEITGIF